MNKNIPLRIALVTSEYVTEPNFDGGLSNYVHRVALSLVELGHQPIVVVASDSDDIFIHKGIEVHRVKIIIKSNYLQRNYLLSFLQKITFNLLPQSTYYIYMSWRLRSALESINKNKPVSIIQYASCGGLGLFRLPKVPCVVRISGYLPLWHHVYNIKNNLDLKISEKIEEIAYSKVDNLFAPSLLNAKAVQNAVNRIVKVIETPFTLDVIEKDYDYSLFTRYLENKKYLLFFGSISKVKGCLTIGDIIAELLGIYPDIYFVFIGKNKYFLEKKSVDIMGQIKEKAGLYKNRIVHLEKMPHDTLYPIVKNAHAVVLPSIMDNLPNTCLEAMAHKRVVIGTKGASFEQLIEDGISGFLCEKDNPRDLLKAIQKVLGLSHQDRQKIGDIAYQRILEMSPQKVVNQLIDFYQETILKFNNQLI